MAPPESHFNRPASTKNQRNDLINELDSFQNSLRNSNVAAFNKIGISGSISNQGVSNNPNYKGLEGLERSLTSKMKNFHQVF